jgi:hypothetical protein
VSICSGLPGIENEAQLRYTVQNGSLLLLPQAEHVKNIQSIYLYNAKGQLVYDLRNPEHGELPEQLCIADLKPGLYVLAVVQRKGVVMTYKLVI